MLTGLPCYERLVVPSMVYCVCVLSLRNIFMVAPKAASMTIHQSVRGCSNKILVADIVPSVACGNYVIIYVLMYSVEPPSPMLVSICFKIGSAVLPQDS
jgi:hypothetical protein